MFEPQSADDAPYPGAPLAARMRPRSFDDYVGQEHIVGDGQDPAPPRRDAARCRRSSSGGRPAPARRRSRASSRSSTDAAFVPVSAVSAGVADLRKAVAEARERLQAGGGRTVLFIDEIHRFNKAQQDAILPFVEDGTITLIGATTENPSFEVIGPLLSRSRVFALKQLEPPDIERIIRGALADAERGLGGSGVDGRRRRDRGARIVGRRRRAHRAQRARSRRLGRARSRRASGRTSRARTSRRRCSTARTSTTARATRTTTRSPRSSSRCAAPTPTRRSTGSRA